MIGGRVCFDPLSRKNTQKCGRESWDAITRLASFADADRLTDRRAFSRAPSAHDADAD
jgi:hypothetical protein